MAFTDILLAEFDQEMKTTRSLLERVPFEKGSFKPHDKSTALDALASHIANLAGFGVALATKSELDFAPDGGPPRIPAPAKNTQELLEKFDANVVAARSALASVSEDRLGDPWSLKMGEHTIFTLPRGAAIRSMMMNHIIHHRGQLSVYLRLNDVPLPSIYGPTADT